MKILFFSAAIFITPFCFAQEADSIDNQEIYRYSSETVSLNPDTKIIEYIDKVNFESSKLTVINADKICVDKKTDEITVTGADSFTFKGTAIVTCNGDSNTFTYKLGDDFVYIK